MNTLKFNGKSVQVPESWFELTTESWVKLLDITDLDSDLELVSAITGLTLDELERSEDLTFDMKVLALMSWYAEPIKFTDLTIPDHIEINDKVIKIPKDLGFKTLGQKILVQQYVKKSMSYNHSLVYAFAVYIAPIYYDDNDYNYEDLDEFINGIVNKLPITIVHPIGNFFLERYIDLLKLKIDSYLKLTMRTK